MTTVNQQPSPPRRWPPLRVGLAVIALLLLSAGALVLVLHLQGVISLSMVWTATLTTGFVLFGIIASIGQWILPFASLPNIAPAVPLAQGSVAESSLDAELEMLRQRVERNLDKRAKRGALIVVTIDSEVGQDTCAVSQCSWVRFPNARDQLSGTHKRPVKRHQVGDSYVCAAIFRDLEPDDYATWNDISQPIFVPVFPNQAIMIDRR